MQNVAMVLNQILDLTALEGYIEIAEELRQMQELLRTAEALWWDITSLQAQIDALFGLEGAPITAVGLEIRLGEIRIEVFQAYSYAMRVQTLLMTAVSAMEHLFQLIDQFRIMIGNMQGQQVLAQGQSKLIQVAQEHKAVTASFNQAEAIKELQAPLIAESLKRINEGMMADHPR